MIGPKDGGLLPLREMGRVHVAVRADSLDLGIGDSRHLTKRGVVRQSVGAVVHLARLDDHHILDLGREQATRPLPLHNGVEEE
jgi:hypothetical protein